ncbi:MAG: sigma-70 family RNA polymerase sigma factor [Ferruginibacter sp.]
MPSSTLVMTEALTIPQQMTAEKKNNITHTINEYSKRLFGFIRKRVNNEADAEDILQDVFYQFIGNTQPIEQLSGWLFTVARNKITDLQRKKKTGYVEEIFDAGEEDTSFDWTELFFDGADNPETTYLRNLFWESMQEALEELPKEQRDVFVLNEIDGIPFKILSEQSGETVNTLLSRKRYAVLHLRERLQVLRDELLNY